MKRILFIYFLLAGTVSLFSQHEKHFLWKGIEGMKSEKTRLYVYEPADSLRNDVSVIICPGGSYAHLYGIKWEGFEVAEWLNQQGITAFVLQYRVAQQGYRHPAMIQDIQRAIQWVRENSGTYKIDPDLVGVMGFSAGGHLSLMAGTFYDEDYLQKLPVTNSHSLKPAFIVPVYPVVSMQDSIAHKRSRKNLLGKNFDREMQDKFSMELQVNENMPPVFLVTTKDDPVVLCQNSIVLAEALENASVSYRFLLYEKGGHGFGMNKKKGGEAAEWKSLFKEWLMENGFIQ